MDNLWTVHGQFVDSFLFKIPASIPTTFRHLRVSRPV
jgi:hypothetical protein